MIGGWVRGSMEDLAEKCNANSECFAFARQYGWHDYAQLYDSTYSGLHAPQTMWVSCIKSSTVTYQWDSSDSWSSCNCNTQQKTRNVVCKGSDGSVGADSQRSGSKPTTTQSCASECAY